MTEATEARLEQIIKLAQQVNSHTCAMIQELAERALADERATDSVDRRQHESS